MINDLPWTTVMDKKTRASDLRVTSAPFLDQAKSAGVGPLSSLRHLRTFAAYAAILILGVSVVVMIEVWIVLEKVRHVMAGGCP